MRMDRMRRSACSEEPRASASRARLQADPATAIFPAGRPAGRSRPEPGSGTSHRGPRTARGPLRAHWLRRARPRPAAPAIGQRWQRGRALRALRQRLPASGR